MNGLHDSVTNNNSVDSLAVPNTSEVAGKTAFVQEALAKASILGPHFVGSSMVKPQGDIQELTQYYARPRLLKQGPLPVSVRERIFNIPLSPHEIFQVLTAGGLDRLTGVFGLRFTLNFTFQVAATPFHQGLLALSWQYGNGSGYSRASRSFTCTNLPHIRCDLSTDTMVTLRVPFMYYVDFVRKHSTERYGNLALNTILPVASVDGLSPPTYKLYMHVDDLEFVGVSPHEERDYPVLQSGAVFEKEQSSVSGKTVSKTLRWVASGVPSIVSIAGKAGWFLERAAGVMAAFGFAKPQDTHIPQKVYNMSNVLEHNVDVPAQVAVLAPTSTNHLAIGTEFTQTDIDEMSLAYVLSQNSQICVGNMGVGDAHGVMLYATNISPSWFWARAPSALPYINRPMASLTETQDFIPSHVFNVASMFRYWRGDFTFRFTFAKSKMHAGRVVVSFVPNPINGADRYGEWSHSIKTPEMNSVGIQPTGYTAIFDLKDSNVFEFKVPYSGLTPFTRFWDTIGSLSMIVMDPLQAPAVVSPSVPFLVEVCCDNNFELSCPCGPQYPPSTPYAVELQSGAVTSTYDDGVSQYTMGERINSIKQLIMMPKQTTLSYKGGVWDMDIMPWFYQPRQSVLRPLPSLVNESLTYGGVLAQCYLYCRGSTDLHVYHAADSPLVKTSAFITDLTDGDETEHVACTPLVDSSSGALHVRVPSYQMVPRMSTQAFHERQWSPQFSDTGLTLPNQFVSSVDEHDYGPTVLPRLRFSYLSKTGLSNAILKRSAGDDALLGHYMGPVPLAYTELPDPDFPTKVTIEFQSGFPTPAIPEQEQPLTIPKQLGSLVFNTYNLIRQADLLMSEFKFQGSNDTGICYVYRIRYQVTVPMTNYYGLLVAAPEWAGVTRKGWLQSAAPSGFQGPDMPMLPRVYTGGGVIRAEFFIAIYFHGAANTTVMTPYPPYHGTVHATYTISGSFGPAGAQTIPEVLGYFPSTLSMPTVGVYTTIPRTDPPPTTPVTV